MRVLSLLILLLAVFSIWSTLGTTPAFNPALRSDSVRGDWRLVLSTALYDRGEYEFQRGFGYIEASGLFAPDPERAEDPEAVLALLNERSDFAVDALNKAVSLDPGNAHAWVALGLSHARRAEDFAALNALRTSWKIAPYNRVLAETRMTVAAILADPELSQIKFTEEDRDAVTQDAQTLAQFDRRSLDYYRETAPQLQGIWQLADK